MADDGLQPIVYAGVVGRMITEEGEGTRGCKYCGCVREGVVSIRRIGMIREMGIDGEG
jgi:hypothetical protein